MLPFGTFRSTSAGNVDTSDSLGVYLIHESCCTQLNGEHPFPSIEPRKYNIRVRLFYLIVDFLPHEAIKGRHRVQDRQIVVLSQQALVLFAVSQEHENSVRYRVSICGYKSRRRCMSSVAHSGFNLEGSQVERITNIFNAIKFIR